MAQNRNDSEQDNISQIATEHRPETNNADIVHHYHVNKILLRHNILLHCSRIFRTDGLRSEFQIINELLDGILFMKRAMLKDMILPMIPPQSRGDPSYNNIVEWLSNGSILKTQYLQFLSIALKMTFHRCTVENHHIHGSIFVPTDQNHDIANTIYYICDTSGQNIQVIFITDRAYINHIYKKLTTTNNISAKPELYNILISEYIKQANNLRFHQHLLVLSIWQEVYRCYKARLQINRDFLPDEFINYFRSLMMICKYSEAEEMLNNLLSTQIIKRTVTTLCLLAKVQRKRKKYPDDDLNKIKYGKYDAANASITEALSINPENKEALNEKKIIDILRSKPTSPKLDLNSTRRIGDDLSYNILSIDGGGIRGIIPAIWLSELERRTHRSCSSMFQMMAGTSTGAIIAAGLSTPSHNNASKSNYDASTLVQLYDTCGSQIFAEKYRPWWAVLAAKYSPHGKRALFHNYFHQTFLHECLTDIVIPAVTTGHICTHLFTRNESFYSTSIVDVLMATTAAPTYFDPHLINDTYYIDGGVQMNNPTLAAYTKAMEYGYKKENIFVLSLDTGDSIQDPLVSNAQRDIFFYTDNYDQVLRVLFGSQQNTVDYQMSNLMNEKTYYRWQVWFEEAIGLDTYAGNMVEKLKNIAYEYWAEMEVYDEERLRGLINHFTSGD